MGDKIFFPNSAQFDEMNQHLARIASAVGSHVDISTWGGIQKAVRAGIAPDVLPIGTQLKVSHSYYGDHLYDVVAHDYFKSVHNENAHTMTLLSHDVLDQVIFDNGEAFYCADSDMPIGTYNYTLESSYSDWPAGTYQFSTDKIIPKGSHFTFFSTMGLGMVGNSVHVYAAPGSSALYADYKITSGNDGTRLGTLGKELNHAQRVAYGSGNYKESAIRQFLNSPSPTFSWWKPQTKFDRYPYTAPTFGFMSGFDDEFLACVGKVIVPCAANNAYESSDSTTKLGEQYTVSDYFYLASQVEIFGISTDTGVDSSIVFPYFEDAIGADRIKYSSGAAAGWLTRSASSWSASGVRIVQADGNVNHYGANNPVGLVPAFTIV